MDDADRGDDVDDADRGRRHAVEIQTSDYVCHSTVVIRPYLVTTSMRGICIVNAYIVKTDEGL